MRIQRAFVGFAHLAGAGLALAAALLTLEKIGALEAAPVEAWWVAVSLPLLGLFIGFVRPVAPRQIAHKVDGSHHLHSRLSNALEFSAQASRTEFEDAAIRDAILRAPDVRPPDAVRFSVPSSSGAVAGLGVACLLLTLLETPVHSVGRGSSEPSPGLESVRLSADDLESFQEDLEPILRSEVDDVLQRSARAFNQILEDLADERVDRAEALRRIAELEREIGNEEALTPGFLEDALRELGRDLQSADLAETAAEALDEANAQAAAEAFEQLAEEVEGDAASRRDIERLRRALERAGRRDEENRRELDELRQREEELNRLLQRDRPEEESTEPDPADERLLRRRQRELERLSRERESLERSQRELERLRREMQRSAEALQRQDRQSASEALERSAADLNRMSQNQLTDQQRQQLEQQLQQLREMIRRGQAPSQSQSSGRGDESKNGQGSRQQRFVLRAQGQDGQAGQNGQGSGSSPGSGQPGSQGESGNGDSTVVLDPNGNPGQSPGGTLEIPGAGESSTPTTTPGSGPAAGDGASLGGRSDATMLDDPTDLDSRTRTVRVEGEVSDGPSRSEVIYDSARRGFVSRSYRAVHTDYADHAESVLERDEIPPGYRFYVRRYFQLIRPREEPRP